MLNSNFLKLMVLGLVIALLGYVFSTILLYIIISLVLATLLKPLVNFIRHVQVFGLTVPRVVAVLLSIGLFFTVIVLLVTLFYPLLYSQLAVLSALKDDDLLIAFEKPLADLEAFLLRYKLVNQDTGFLRKQLTTWHLNLTTTDAVTFINNVVEYTSGLFVGMVAVLFISFFLLYDRGILKRFFLGFVPNIYFEVVVTALVKIEKLLANYLTGLLLQIFSIFTFTALGMTIINHPYAITVAVFAAVANVVPYLGPVLAAVFAMAVGFAQPDLASANDYLSFIVRVLIVEGAVKLIDDLVLQPIIFSKSVKAHPLELFVAIFAGASLGGIAGMVAAIPAYTILRVVLAEFYQNYGRYRAFNLKRVIQ